MASVVYLGTYQSQRGLRGVLDVLYLGQIKREGCFQKYRKSDSTQPVYG